MNQYRLETLEDLQALAAVVRRAFPTAPERIERVQEGISTFVYRIVHGRETFYLRVFPEAGDSFAPEVAIHERLRSLQIKVPEVIYFEPYNELLQRSIMIVAEIKGQPLSQSPTLAKSVHEAIVREAGRDLAHINRLAVEGFGWIVRTGPHPELLRGEQPTHRAFALEYWEDDLAFLARHTLPTSDIALLEQVRTRYDSWLDVPQALLAHGDLDITHIFQYEGRYTGIIDFGEIRGTSQWYDLGHFHMRDGESPPYRLTSALIQGYADVMPLPSSSEQYMRFHALLINVRALVNSLRKRPPNRYTDHQIVMLREDLAYLST